MEEKPPSISPDAAPEPLSAFNGSEKKGELIPPKRDKRLENLQTWKPGQSGNPGGKKRRATPLMDALERRVTKELGTGANASTVADAIAAKLVQIATTSRSEQRALDAIALIFERVEGKATQRVEATGADGGPMIFETPASRAEAEQRIQQLLSRRHSSGAESQGSDG